MKLATVQVDHSLCLVAQSGDGTFAIDLAAAAREIRGGPQAVFDCMLSLIEAGPAGLAAARQVLDRVAEGAADGARMPIGSLRFAPPLVPPRMLCFSVYEQHMKQAFESVIEMRTGRFMGGLVRKMGVVKMPKAFYRKPLYYKGNNLSVSGHEQDVLWPRWSRMMD